MRWVVLVAIAFVGAACGGGEKNECEYMGRTYAIGAMFANGCNWCTCEADGEVACTLIACADANPMACAPSGSCPGPACGSGCCGVGERCEGGVCRCGPGGSACADGDTCAAGGPIGTDQCGSICCGASGPCPQ